MVACNPNAPTVNGFANENTLLVPDTTNFFAVWVPVGSTWTVTGLFTNDLADGYEGIDPAQATWSISSGMKNKTPGQPSLPARPCHLQRPPVAMPLVLTNTRLRLL